MSLSSSFKYNSFIDHLDLTAEDSRQLLIILRGKYKYRIKQLKLFIKSKYGESPPYLFKNIEEKNPLFAKEQKPLEIVEHIIINFDIKTGSRFLRDYLIECFSKLPKEEFNRLLEEANNSLFKIADKDLRSTAKYILLYIEEKFIKSESKITKTVIRRSIDKKFDNFNEEIDKIFELVNQDILQTEINKKALATFIKEKYLKILDKLKEDSEFQEEENIPKALSIITKIIKKNEENYKPTEHSQALHAYRKTAPNSEQTASIEIALSCLGTMEYFEKLQAKSDNESPITPRSYSKIFKPSKKVSFREDVESEKSYEGNARDNLISTKKVDLKQSFYITSPTN